MFVLPNIYNSLQLKILPHLLRVARFNFFRRTVNDYASICHGFDLLFMGLTFFSWIVARPVEYYVTGRARRVRKVKTHAANFLSICPALISTATRSSWC